MATMALRPQSARMPSSRSGMSDNGSITSSHKTSGGNLTSQQAALYSALFGTSPPPSDVASTAATPQPQHTIQSPTRMGGEDGAEAKQIERAVRKAMRGAAIERQQAVDAALHAQREEHVAELRGLQQQIRDERDAAAAEAMAHADEQFAKERQRLAKEAARDRAGAVSKAVDAAEKAREVQWRKVLASHEEETEARLEAAAREKENAIRKVHRQKDAAVSDAMKTAREKLKSMEVEGAKAAEAERERALSLEKAAKKAAMQKAEMMNERTWAEAESLRAQAVAAAKAEAAREHKALVDHMRATHEAERVEMAKEMSRREAEANERADERLARLEEQHATMQQQMTRRHAADMEAERAVNAQAIENAKRAAREEAMEEARREKEEAIQAALAAAKKEAERERRAALRATAAEAEKALKKVMEQGRRDKEAAVAKARKQFEEELLASP